jgi:hypothetical protein
VQKGASYAKHLIDGGTLEEMDDVELADLERAIRRWWLSTQEEQEAHGHPLEVVDIQAPPKRGTSTADRARKCIFEGVLCPHEGRKRKASFLRYVIALLNAGQMAQFGSGC